MAEQLVVVACSPDHRRCLDMAARLSRAGIPALVGRRPDLGVPRFAVSVPAQDASAAARCVSSWSSDHQAEQGAYRTAACEPEEQPPARRRRLAAFFALGMAFGLGHVYAREYLAGLILGLGQLACLVLAAQGMAEVLWAFPALVALDAWGAMRAVDRENEGRRREPAAQLAAALPAVAILLAGAAMWMPSPRGGERPVASVGCP